MAPPPLAPAGGRLAARRATAHRGNKSVLLALAAFGGLALWCCSSAGASFAVGRATHLQGVARVGHRSSPTQRRAGYAFELAKSDDHTELVVRDSEDYANTKRVWTQGSFFQGTYNTVLGDTEFPTSGRSYWEVKIVKKASDAWEYIGVAEPTADVTVPLTRNKKGAGWFWGSTGTESFMYTYFPMRPEFNQVSIKHGQGLIKGLVEKCGFAEKDATELVMKEVEGKFKGPGTHVGTIQDLHPPFQNGLVVGIDVDMDDGSLAFWADGKYLGKVKDTEGKPINLKGKKVVPALTVYGRKMGGHNEFTIMEVTTGLDPPPRP